MTNSDSAGPGRPGGALAPAASRALRVNFVPRWPTNPYHQQLEAGLARCNVTIAPESQLKDIVNRGHTPDVIHLHALPPFSLRPGSLARYARFWLRLRRSRRAGARVVWTVHDIGHHESLHPRVDRFFSRLLYRKADALIVHTAGARSTIETQWRVHRSDRVFVIPHGHFIGCYPAVISAAEARAGLGLPADAQVFLFFGLIRPYKGVVPLVRDFLAVATPRMRLVIAGQVLTPELQHEIETAIGGSPQIVFHPRFVPDAEVQNYLHAADAVVFPYTRALTSGALILAMSFGRACIAPRMGALGDTLDITGGLLFDPSAPTGLRDALAAASALSPLSLTAMGAYNRRRAGTWSWDETARRTAAAYQAALAA